jgi:anti-sigma factor ChrR (cupin superfamily)
MNINDMTIPQLAKVLEQTQNILAELNTKRQREVGDMVFHDKHKQHYKIVYVKSECVGVCEGYGSIKIKEEQGIATITHFDK